MHGHRPWRWRFSSHAAINAAVVLFSVTLVGLLWGAVLATLRIDRAETIRAAEQRNGGVAIAFEQYTIRTIESADAIVRYLIREYARSGARTDLAKFVADYTIDNKSLVGIVLADERGNAVTTTRSGQATTNVADRPHFRVHMERDSDMPSIGRPVVGRFSGKTVVPITRRINKADGSFGGVAMALIEPSRFTDLLHEAVVRPLDIISLVGYDGITRARLSGSIASSGEDIRKSVLVAELPVPAVGNILAPGRLDGVPRFYSYRKLPDYRLVVIVAVAEADVLAQFNHRRSQYFWAAALASALIIGFGVLLMLALARQWRTAAKVVSGQARFLATFEQAAVGIAHCDLNGRYLEVNQKLCDILGYSKAEMLGRRFSDVTHPDDLPANPDVRSQLLQESGKRIAIEREKRYIRKDGAIVWCAITVSAVHEDTGGIEYVLVVVQDIMDRKRAEAALGGRTARLQQLSRKLMRVQEHERRRLGRELHDRTGANLSALLLSLEVLRGKFPSDIAPELLSAMGRCELLLREAITHVRDVLGNLRPPALDELGLLAALNHYIRTVGNLAGIEISTEGREPSPRLAADEEISLFRIAQEAINNATRHGQATRIRVALHPGAAEVTLTIEDDGKGFDAASLPQGSSSLGLITMRERADAMHAQFIVEAVPGKGTRITAIVPFQGSPTP
jgi:PAS domain S-box-containing protein